MTTMAPEQSAVLDLAAARPGQLKAFVSVVEAVRGFVVGVTDRAEWSVMLPTGYGKSDLIRACMIELSVQGLIACGLVISPDAFLRGQLVEKKKMQGFVERWKPVIPGGRGFRYTEIKSRGLRYHANGEMVLSTTIQLILADVGSFVDWIDSVHRETGKLVLIWVDEDQTYSHANVWGDAIKRMERAGAFVVVSTATPYREDGEPLIGFQSVWQGSEDVKFTTMRPGPTEDLVTVQRWKGSRDYYEVAADVSHSFKEAWDEGNLCHVTDQTFDVDLRLIDADAGEMKDRRLSDMSKSEALGVLGKLVRHPLVIRQACELVDRWVRDVRRTGIGRHAGAALIRCQNDEGEVRNDHAEQIKRVLRSINPSLDVRIATTAEDGLGGAKGKDTLDDFVHNSAGDVLIVKQMAGRGLDAERIKVVCDLSSMRTPNSFIQFLNRGTRPWGSMMTAHFISPADPSTRELFTRFITDQGGQATKTTAELVDEYDIERVDDPPPAYVVTGASASDLYDTKHNRAEIEALMGANYLIQEMPVILDRYTVPEIIAKARGMIEQGWKPDVSEEETILLNTGDEIEQTKYQVNQWATIIINARFRQTTGRSYRRGNEGDKETYSAIARSTWSEMKGIARFPRGKELDAVKELEAHKRLLSVAEEIAKSTGAPSDA